MNFLILSFLYIPEDKTEYIPASIWIVFALIAAVIAMRVFIKISKKEAQKAKELEEAYQQQNKAEYDRQENRDPENKNG